MSDIHNTPQPSTISEHHRALELFESGFYCAESVLLALAEDLGIDSPHIPALATGFCSGLGRTGGTCGAVNGAVMAIGLACGRKSPRDSIEPAYALVNAFLDRFRDIYGSLECRDILGAGLADPAERQRLAREGVISETCPQLTARAAALALQLIRDSLPAKVAG